VSIPTRQVLGILADNLLRRGSVLPLSRKGSTGWAEGLGIPFGGKTVLYTGLMYQLMPSMIALGRLLSRLEDSPAVRLMGVGRVLNRYLDASRFISVLVNREDQRAFDDLLRKVTLLLRETGVEFGYLYEWELYAGALAHDQGLCATFRTQAERVRALLRRNGVRQVITVDPHTTHVLRSVYPRLLGEGRVEVRSYLEVLAEGRIGPSAPLEGALTIHDSCVYARHEHVMEEPRFPLREAGIQVLEPEFSGKMTFCCGGPIESLFPSKAREIAHRRMDQLRTVHDRVVTMCPICLVNLREAAQDRDMVVADISTWLDREAKHDWIKEVDSRGHRERHAEGRAIPAAG